MKATHLVDDYYDRKVVEERFDVVFESKDSKNL